LTAPAAWDRPSAGTTIELRKLKWNDPEPAWEVTAQVRSATGDELVVAVAEGTRFKFADGSDRIARETSVYTFRRGAWWHAINSDARGQHWYCDITTPAEMRSGVLSWHDLELDASGFADGSWLLADIPEFQRALATFPARFEPEAVRAAHELVDRIERHAAPFDGQAEATVYGPEEHLFWIIPGVGDGLAFVGEELGTSGEATAARILDRFEPATTFAAASDPATLAADRTPPLDGIVMLGTVREPDTLCESLAILLRIWERPVYAQLVLVAEEALDPRDDLRAALGPSGAKASASLRLDTALRTAGIAPRGVISAQRFVAATWF
jgi:protein associated with RNAse G/E